MLPMKITTRQDLIEVLSGSSIKRVVAEDIRTSRDLEEVIKSAKAMLKTSDGFKVFLVAG
jgi:hypothetical protein